MRDGVPRLHEPPPPASAAGDVFADVFLHDMCVDPSFRGLGLGAALVRTLLRRHQTVHLVSLPESTSYWRHAGATEMDADKQHLLPSYPLGSVHFLLTQQLHRSKAAACRENRNQAL